MPYPPRTDGPLPTANGRHRRPRTRRRLTRSILCVGIGAAGVALAIVAPAPSAVATTAAASATPAPFPVSEAAAAAPDGPAVAATAIPAPFPVPEAAAAGPGEQLSVLVSGRIPVASRNRSTTATLLHPDQIADSAASSWLSSRPQTAPAGAALAAAPPTATPLPAASSPPTSSPPAPLSPEPLPPGPPPPTSPAPPPSHVLPAQGRFTSCFCERWGEWHGGLDLANSHGTPEVAAAAGTVIVAGPAGGFGQWVQIRHVDGTVTVYGHMATIDVGIGQRVSAGDLIATMGAEGNSTGPHLHFEVWPGGDRASRIDPTVWLAEHGVALPEYTP